MDGFSSGGCGLPSSPFLAGQPPEDLGREEGEGEGGSILASARPGVEVGSSPSIFLYGRRACLHSRKGETWTNKGPWVCCLLSRGCAW